MKIIGLFSPSTTRGPLLALNSGWVMGHAGLETVLLDFDPGAHLTELALPDPVATIDDALSPLFAGGSLGQVTSVELAPGLSIIAGHGSTLVLDERLGAGDPLARTRLGRFVRHAGAESGADLVLCSLAPNLGPLNHTLIEIADGIVIALDVRGAKVTEAAVSSVLDRWGQRSKVLGYVLVGTPSEVREPLEWSTSMQHLGTVYDYPGLTTMARVAHKAQLALTAADGATGTIIKAVGDLHARYEALATAIINRVGFDEDDLLRDELEQALLGLFDDELPSELDSLSSRTTIRSVADLEIEEIEVRSRGMRIRGTASVSVGLEWAGGEARDGLGSSASFPARFDVELDRSREAVTRVHQLEVDTSSWSE